MTDLTNTSFTKAGLALVVACAGLLVSGCNREKVEVYEVPKESSAPPPMTSAMPPGDPHTGLTMPQPSLSWDKLPEGWTQSTEPSSMRLATFKINGEGGGTAEVAIIPMGGFAGTDVQLVNMWRSQLGLDKESETEAATEAKAVKVGGDEGKLYEMTGSSGGNKTGLMVASVSKGGMNFFFKMLGDEALVESQRAAFLNFLEGIDFNSAAPAATAPMMASATPPSGAKPWDVPEGWEELPPAQFLLAKYRVPGEGDASADVNVSRLSGDGGGTLANVNRWRRQLGLGPVDEAALATCTKELKVADHPGLEVLLDGKDARTGQPAKMLGVIIPLAGETWFFKLTGSADVVDGHKEEFLGFVRSARL